MPFYLRRHHQQIPDVIYGATVPFFGAQNDYPLIQDRTGVLLQIGDRHFLLTAVHELGQWFDLQAKTLLADESIFTSSGQVVYHEAAARGDETIRLEFVWCEFLTGVLDVAILELDEDSVQRLDGMTFLKVGGPGSTLQPSAECPSCPWSRGGIPALAPW